MRTVEIHVIKDNPHSDGMLMVFLPKEKIVIEADVFTPAAAAAAAAINRSTLNFVDNLEKLKFDFDKILPLHGAGAVSRADLYAAVRKPAPAYGGTPGADAAGPADNEASEVRLRRPRRPPRVRTAGLKSSWTAFVCLAIT